MEEYTNGLFGLIGDEDMCVGFALAGICDYPIEKNSKCNFMIVDKDTDNEDVIHFFLELRARKDITIILVSVDVIQRIQPLKTLCSERIFPVVLEVPSKTNPFVLENDEMYLMALRTMFDS